MIAAAGHDDGNEMVDPYDAAGADGGRVLAAGSWDRARASAGGVTAIQVLPGSGNLIGGRAFTVKLRPALSPREMHVKGAPDGLQDGLRREPEAHVREPASARR